MKYVLDASVAIKWALPEADSLKALALRDDYRNAIHELIAPDIFQIEVAHALTRAERRNILQRGEALKELVLLMQARPRLYPFGALLGRAVEISSLAGIGVYDSVYVALSEREQCPIVTSDNRLIAEFPSHTVSLSSL